MNDELDEVFDLQDDVLRSDYWYSGIPVRRPGSAPVMDSLHTMTKGRRAWIRKLKGESDDRMSKNH